MNSPLRIVAIVAIFNETDIIRQTVDDLIQQDIDVYVIDNGSTDGGPDLLRDLVGRGVIAIESFAGDGGGLFALTALLKRKEALAHELPGDWFINHDADEFRESPWSHMTLRQGIETVDRLGFNAIDFAVLTFPPTAETFKPEVDIRRTFTHWEPGAPWDRLQIRCWKRTATPVELASSGGHDARFAGRRVFPVRFILRHYPIRGSVHGRRKVFTERLERFDPAERAQGWHVQYDHIAPDHDFLRRTSELTPYHPDEVRFDLQLPLIASVEREASLAAAREASLNELSERLRRSEETVANREASINELAERLNRSEEAVAAQAAARRSTERRLEELEADCLSVRTRAEGHAAELQASIEHLASELARVHRHVHEIHASLSWRMTSPVRRLGTVLASLARRLGIATKSLPR